MFMFLANVLNGELGRVVVECKLLPFQGDFGCIGQRGLIDGTVN